MNREQNSGVDSKAEWLKPIEGGLKVFKQFLTGLQLPLGGVTHPTLSRKSSPKISLAPSVLLDSRLLKGLPSHRLSSSPAERGILI